MGIHKRSALTRKTERLPLFRDDSDRKPREIRGSGLEAGFLEALRSYGIAVEAQSYITGERCWLELNL
jgi:hypothetical protein